MARRYAIKMKSDASDKSLDCFVESLLAMTARTSRHCEEASDEAIRGYPCLENGGEQTIAALVRIAGKIGLMGLCVRGLEFGEVAGDVGAVGLPGGEDTGDDAHEQDRGVGGDQFVGEGDGADSEADLAGEVGADGVTYASAEKPARAQAE